jgi:Contact-dependent growth inhibition CdiA C-terminal domain
MPYSNKIGTIVIPPGVFVTIHEKRAADFIAIHTGNTIAFILPDRQIGRKSPDIKMAGHLWEIKSPKGKTSRTIENNLRLALQQSPYIILDVRRMDGRIPTKRLSDETRRQFTLSKKIKKILLITRLGPIIDFHR